jgi:LemA protein
VLILVFTALIVAGILYGVWAYTMMMGKRERALNAWGQIDLQLKHRHDLARELVNAIRGYSHSDHEVLEKVSRDRLNAIQAGSNVAARGKAENVLTQSMRSLVTLSEAVPDIAERRPMRELQHDVQDTEARLTVAREFYNAAAREYNDALRSFPGALFADRLGMEPAAHLDLDNPPERVRPWVLH